MGWRRAEVIGGQAGAVAAGNPKEGGLRSARSRRLYPPRSTRRGGAILGVADAEAGEEETAPCKGMADAESFEARARVVRWQATGDGEMRGAAGGE